MIKLLSTLIFILFTSTLAFSQYVGEYTINEGNCDFFIRDKNWPEGIVCFSALVKEDSANLDYQYKLAKCYTNGRANKKKGLEMLLKLSEKNYAADDMQELLAMAHFYNNQFAKAKSLFTALLADVTDGEKIEQFEKMVKQCDVSLEMMKRPVYVSFENLGKYVNSDAPDFLPIAAQDESTVYFTTKRKGVVGNLGSSEGYKTADIFYVKHKRNKYSRARSVGSPNTFGNEYAAGRSENSNYIFYIANNDDYFDDIFISEMGRRSYMAPDALQKEELKKTSERGATISNDGQLLYFSSDREGGEGGYDIWFMRKLPTGDWGDPVNMGNKVNTAGDEKYPTLINNGTTLYFSSNGHKGMGGMDVFKSILKGNTNEWSKAINLGYPVNTTEDELNISFTKNPRYAYMAQVLDGGFGDLDIYRLTFAKERDDYTLLKGLVLNADSSKIDADITVEIFSSTDGELFGTYKVNRKKGKYNAILPAGAYLVEVRDVEGYVDFEKSITVLGKNDLREQTKLDIILTRK